MGCDYKIYIQENYYNTFHCTHEIGYGFADVMTMIFADQEDGKFEIDRTQPYSVRIEKVIT